MLEESFWVVDHPLEESHEKFRKKSLIALQEPFVNDLGDFEHCVYSLIPIYV